MHVDNTRRKRERESIAVIEIEDPALSRPSPKSSENSKGERRVGGFSLKRCEAKMERSSAKEQL
jgi:hypothetical protein